MISVIINIYKKLPQLKKDGLIFILLSIFGCFTWGSHAYNNFIKLPNDDIYSHFMFIVSYSAPLIIIILLFVIGYIFFSENK